MSFAKNNRPGWSLRSTLMLWTTLVSAAALLAAFGWIHFNLRFLLESRIDQFLDRKLAELRKTAEEPGTADPFELLSTKIERESQVYRDPQLILFARRGDELVVAPSSGTHQRLVELLSDQRFANWPRTVAVPGEPDSFRTANMLAAAGDGHSIYLGAAFSLKELEATLDQFDRLIAGGGAVFLGIAILGGFQLLRKALRPVGVSIATARRLNPQDLSARLPRTGSQDELDQLAATINQLLDRLASYHEQITRFTADASHELRGPLSAMRATIEVALQNPRSNSEYHDVLGLVAEQCERLANLANSLLLLAKVDAGQITLHRDPLELADVIDGIVEIYGPLAEENGVLLDWQPVGPLSLTGDEAWLSQLFSNLIDNALKFTPAGGRVELRAERHGNEIQVSVRDTGVGIPAEDVLHIFDRFYQVDSARSTRGTGLGLSICRWVAQAHNGTLTVSSRQGQGATFLLSLPAALEPPLRGAKSLGAVGERSGQEGAAATSVIDGADQA